MTPDEYQKLQEISRLLKEAYDHYFEYEGHCKSAEGRISIDYGTLWDREDPNDMSIRGVEIYSYVFCREGRSQFFTTVDVALEVVRGWHVEEMAYDYNSPEALENQRMMDEMAADFLEKMIDSERLTIIDVDLSDEDEQYGFPV